MFDEIIDRIKKYETVAVFRHMRPDPDAIGSQCGLREILRENFPDKKIVALGYDESTLVYLSKMDQPVDFDGGFLAIVCDTANRPRIDGGEKEVWRQAIELIKIDHHPNEDAYGDIQWVEPNRSSTSEMIAEFAYSSNLTVPSQAARLLYAGIIGDTGRFLYPSTSAQTLAIAAKLAEEDFDRSLLGREMTSFDMKIARLTGYVYEHLEISSSGAARVILPRKVLVEYGVRDGETSMIVGLPGNIRTVKSWAIFVEQEDLHFRVRIRSKEVPINEIAKAHEGGGHEMASGANSYSQAENEKIWQELQKNLNEKR